jgi:hypothetical protein
VTAAEWINMAIEVLDDCDYFESSHPAQLAVRALAEHDVRDVLAALYAAAVDAHVHVTNMTDGEAEDATVAALDAARGHLRLALEALGRTS